MELITDLPAITAPTSEHQALSSALDITVQILSRSGKVKKQIRTKGNTVSIGRALDNDVLLTEPHCCGYHAVIKRDDKQQLELIDLDSVNGIRPSSRTKAIKNGNILKFTSGDVFYLGKQKIRILNSDHPVEATLPITRTESIVEYFSRPTVTFFTALIFVTYLLLEQYLGTTNEYSWKKALSPLISTGIIMLIWPSFWSLIARSLKHEARFLAHLSTLLICVLTLAIVEKGIAILGYNSASKSLYSSLVFVLLIVGSLTVYHFTLYLSCQLKARRHWLVTGALSCLSLACLYTLQYTNKADFSLIPQYSTQLLSPQYLFNRGLSTERYISTADNIYQQAQSEIEPSH